METWRELSACGSKGGVEGVDSFLSHRENVHVHVCIHTQHSTVALPASHHYCSILKLRKVKVACLVQNSSVRKIYEILTMRVAQLNCNVKVMQ